MNPYLVLNVPLEATDQQIRKAYLEAVKEASPDSNPKQFQAVSVAYGQIKDEPSRHLYYLLNTDAPAESPLEAFLKYAQLRPQSKPPSLESMKEYLRSCAKT